MVASGFTSASLMFHIFEGSLNRGMIADNHGLISFFHSSEQF
jgi:hypothetical protein